MNWLQILFVILVLTMGFESPTFAKTKKKKKRKALSCVTQEKRCKLRCFRTIRKENSRTIRMIQRKRGRCIKFAWRTGKKCVRGSACPEADKCYALCDKQGDSLKCYIRKKCPDLRVNCHTVCQVPLGSSLKSCLKQTSEGLSMVRKKMENREIVCSKRCLFCERKSK